ncbi:hypothetical protein HY408_02460 [Candidatus Gottesmanbacteria bacterium]|nr:hypothetical protein [Candidatus Gottesmanbacteria bacterium]
MPETESHLGASSAKQEFSGLAFRIEPHFLDNVRLPRGVSRDPDHPSNILFEKGVTLWQTATSDGEPMFSPPNLRAHAVRVMPGDLLHVQVRTPAKDVLGREVTIIEDFYLTLPIKAI